MNSETKKRCSTLYQRWLSMIPVADPMHKELETIRDEPAEITDRFYQDIVFGTAGLRGICGAGTNRMNVYTVGRATQGIANYINAALKTEGSSSSSDQSDRNASEENALIGSTPVPDRNVAAAGTGIGVVICYDCRYHSKEFSELAAEILAGNGIPVYLFPSMRPTPELSFAIRRLHALSGINMTASHNPKEYNGYKVYWEDGAQISGSVSDGMQKAIEQLDFFDTFRRLPLKDAAEKGLVTILDDYYNEAAAEILHDASGNIHPDSIQDNTINLPAANHSNNSAGLPDSNDTAPDTSGKPNSRRPNSASASEFLQIDRAYLDYVATMRLHPDTVLDLNVPVVYTPLNGAGSIPMRLAAAERGFRNFHIVSEQKDPDPEFTTVGYPNPEDPRAFALAEKLGRKIKAQLIIATDPDSDRMAIQIPDREPGSDADALLPEGSISAAQAVQSGNKNLSGFVPLDGNTTGALLIAFRAQSMKEAGTLPRHACMIKSIVTGDLGRRICEDYGISVFEALTGFKNICGRIPELQAKGYTYFFGYEESIGCAPGEAVRDKDGIAAGMILTELAAWLSARGKTIADYLEDLYQKYGYYAQKQVSFVLKGQEGAERIQRIMKAFRDDQPSEFTVPNAALSSENNSPESTKVDNADRIQGQSAEKSSHSAFRIDHVIDYLHGYQDIPASNVLKFVIDEHTWFAVRPSGTEPKIKFYYYTVTDNMKKSEQIIQALAAAVSAWAEAIR